MQFRERLEPLFRRFASVAWAIDVFHGLGVLLCKIYMKRQQKLTFFNEKRMAVEPPENEKEGPEKDGERSEESSISTVYQYKSTSQANSFSNYHNCS